MREETMHINQFQNLSVQDLVNGWIKHPKRWENQGDGWRLTPKALRRMQIIETWISSGLLDLNGEEPKP